MPEIPLEDADGDLQGRRARGFLHPARKKGHRTRDPTQSIPKACLFHATFRTQSPQARKKRFPNIPRSLKDSLPDRSISLLCKYQCSG